MYCIIVTELLHFEIILISFWYHRSRTSKYARKHVKDFHLTIRQTDQKHDENTCKAILLDSKNHTIILYYYSMFKNVCSLYIRRMTGLCLHFRTSVRLPGAAYLMFSRLDPHFEFDTEFDKTLKNQCFSPFTPHQKSSKIPSKYLSTLIK